MKENNKRKQLSLFKKGDYPNYKSFPSYSIFAKYYDYVMRDIHYPTWQNYLMDLLQYHGKKKIGPVLDFACGTGSLTILLKRAGYDVHGLDISSNMIKTAKSKCNKENMTIPFHHGAIWDYNFNDKFDLVYSFNNSLNYVLKENDLYKLMGAIYNSIAYKGLFIFDMTSEYNVIKNFHQKQYYENLSEFAYLWDNSYHQDRSELTSTLDFFIHSENKAYREVHQQKIHSFEDMFKLLSQYFTVTAYESFTFKNPKKKSKTYHFVCSKG